MFDMNVQSVVELLSLEFYRFKRYKTPITMVIIEIEYPDFFEVIESSIRKTDLYQQIDKNLYAIIYSHTDREGGIAAMNNILKSLRTDDIDIIKMAVAEASHNDANEQVLVERAFKEMASYSLPSS